jgi:hypothetical protein
MKLYEEFDVLGGANDNLLVLLVRIEQACKLNSVLPQSCYHAGRQRCNFKRTFLPQYQ